MVLLLLSMSIKKCYNIVKTFYCCFLVFNFINHLIWLCSLFRQIDLVQQPRIILSHETFNSVGSWAITPILASSIEYIDNIILSSCNLDAATAAKEANALPVSVTASPPSPAALQTKWLILLEDQSIVDLKALINNLQNEDYTKVSAIPIHLFRFCFAVTVCCFFVCANIEVFV